MNRTRVVRLALAATASLAVAMALAAPSVQAAQGSGVPTFQEFKAATYRDLDGQYIVNGDEPLDGKAALKSYYESMVEPVGKTIATGLIGAIAVYFVPRVKNEVQVAALSAALLIGFELVLTHWFYLYIPWFFPFVAFALLVPASMRVAQGEAAAEEPAGERPVEELVPAR